MTTERAAYSIRRAVMAQDALDAFWALEEDQLTEQEVQGLDDARVLLARFRRRMEQA
jgi:hypothetical protein